MLPFINQQTNKNNTVGAASLRYTFFDGQDWNTQVVDSGSEAGSHASLELDSSDDPHISYRKGGIGGNNGNLTYAVFDGQNWNIETVDTTIGSHTSLGLDSSDNPHIGYITSFTFNLKYAFSDGQTWSNQTVDNNGSVVFDTSLEIDQNDNPHIAYFDIHNNNLKYSTKSTTGNQDQTIIDQYDTNTDGQINGSEVRQAIRCFLFGGNSCIRSELTGQRVRQVISKFLFG